MKALGRIPDIVLIISSLIAILLLDEASKRGFVSFYLLSYLPGPLISYYLVTKYGEKYHFPHLKIWKGAAIFVNYIILPILYWRVWQEKKSKSVTK